MCPPESDQDPWQVMPAMIIARRAETPGVVTYSIALQDSLAAQVFSAKPGQFNMLYVPGVGEAAISISGDPTQPHPLVHTIRAVGNVTIDLDRSSVGTTLGIRGPFGSHWPLDQCLGKDLIMIAGGIGLAPLRSVVYQVIAMRDRFATVTLLIGARSPADLLYADQYASWERAGIDVETTVDRAQSGWSGNIGVVTLLLQRLNVPRPEQTGMFTCGPEVMMTYAIQGGMERGIEQQNIWLSLERNMNFAIGNCGHCQLGPHFICKDGPILRYDKVADLMRVDSL